MHAHCGEKAHEVVRNLIGERVPFALARHLSEFTSQIAVAVHLEHRPIIGRGAVKAQPHFDLIHPPAQRLLIHSGDDVAPARDLEVLARNLVLAQALLNLPRAEFLEILSRAKRVEPYAVTSTSRNLEHPRPNRRDGDGRHGRTARGRREGGRHEGELVVFALIVEFFPVSPRTPYRAQ